MMPGMVSLLAAGWGKWKIHPPKAIRSEAKEIGSELDGENADKIVYSFFTFRSHLVSSQVLDACEIARRFARRWLLGSLSPSSTSS